MTIAPRPPYFDIPISELRLYAADEARWQVEPKIDGMWAQVVCNGSTAEIWSRTGRRKGGLEIPTPTTQRSILHGEWVAGSHWGHANGLDKTLHLFDITRHNGRDVSRRPLSERQQLLDQFMDATGLSSRPDVRAVPRWHGREARARWGSEVIGRGFEGLVLKARSGVWGDGWVRMKRSFTMDYVCLGANPGGGRYAGKAASSIRGALWKGDDLVPVAKVMGLSNRLRRDLWQNPESYAGRVFEAEGKGLYPSGALRHPNFLRWRDDKPAAECRLPA